MRIAALDLECIGVLSTFYSKSNHNYSLKCEYPLIFLSNVNFNESRKRVRMNRVLTIKFCDPTKESWPTNLQKKEFEEQLELSSSTKVNWKKIQFFEFKSKHSEEFLGSFNLLVLVLVENRNIIGKDSFQSKNYLPEIKLWFKKYVDLLYWNVRNAKLMPHFRA